MVDKKVCSPDSGSLAIERSQILWHIDVGTPLRFPVYSILGDHPDGLFMSDTGSTSSMSRRFSRLNFRSRLRKRRSQEGYLVELEQLLDEA